VGAVATGARESGAWSCTLSPRAEEARSSSLRGGLVLLKNWSAYHSSLGGKLPTPIHQSLGSSAEYVPSTPSVAVMEMAFANVEYLKSGSKKSLVGHMVNFSKLTQLEDALEVNLCLKSLMSRLS
jgi:hypothetical protein